MSIIDTYVHSDNTEYEIADSATRTRVSAVEGKIPSGASSSNKMATASDITTVTNGVIANTKLIKDTVGWSGKNILNTRIRTYEHNGITYTVLSDKKVHVEGTATARSFINLAVDNTDIPTGDYIMSGTPSGGSSSTYYMRIQSVPDSQSSHHDDYGSGVSFNIASTQPSAIYICVENGVTIDKVFEPMIRKADILDSTYEPYHENVVNVLRDAEVIEGKNLLENKVGNLTHNGVTWTEGADGTVVANGTASALSNYIITERYGRDGYKLFLPNGNYVLNGGVTNGTTLVRVGITKSNAYYNLGDGNGDISFTIDGDDSSNDGAYVQVAIQVLEGKTVSNIVFKPMIRLATETDPTYEPYYIPLKDSMFPRSEQAVLGAKNLFDINFYGSSYEVNGITFAIQTDGRIKCTGTATATPTTTQFSQFLKAGKYILSGCPANGSDSSYRVDLQNVAGVIDYGEGVIFTLATDTTVNVRVRFASGYECPTNGLIFEPMIRLASDPDSTYAPYAMTNRELTEKKVDLFNSNTELSSLDNIPFGMGIMRLASSVSPTGATLTFSYICFGDKSGNKTVIATRMSTQDTYLNTKYEGSWVGWKKVSLTNV